MRRILFIMFDQLRFDYLSCYGHPALHTPHIDRLAAMGVRFTNAYIQSPLCGPSRMSTYTGRYPSSHGATDNDVPLRVGELTLGDHLRELGMDGWLVGKTHMKADKKGMRRLGLAPDSVIGARVAECGFDVFERDDGLRSEGPDGTYDENGALAYNDYLKKKGYDAENPWHDHANSGLGPEGEVLSGWFLENSDKEANIREEDSETPYLTGRAIDFIEANKDKDWLCHLSYIKPHWPYIVPAPYHNMFSKEDFLPCIRSAEERKTSHPIMKALMERRVGRAFHDEDVRDKVLSAYMGLIKQCDDQMGRLFRYLEEASLMEETMIVLTSDHGDYLGDHWMGEKHFFHAPSVKVPLIIYDPSSEANATRGSRCDAVVESIDLVSTFVAYAGGSPADLDHILEGRSLLPYIRGEDPDDGRHFAFSELDYATQPFAEALDIPPQDARMVMIASKDWKLVHFEGGFDPVLFDLKTDPRELVDLGCSADHAQIRETLYAELFRWTNRMGQKVTKSNAETLHDRRDGARTGVWSGVVSPNDVSPEEAAFYIGIKAKDHRHS